MLKLYAKIYTLNLAEFASLKKSHTKIIIVKRSIQFWDVWLVLIYIGSFFKLFVTLPLLISPEREIDEAVNFQNFRNSSQINFLRFYGILAAHFQTGKKLVT